MQIVRPFSFIFIDRIIFDEEWREDKLWGIYSSLLQYQEIFEHFLIDQMLQYKPFVDLGENNDPHNVIY